MNSTKRLIAAAFGFLLVGVVYYAAHRSASRLGSSAAAIHQPAPDFTLPNLDGGTIQLSSYRGKVVLLDFWATWCTPCREETPHFVELQHEYGAQGLQILGVSMDDNPEPVREFYRQFQMNYPVAMGNAKTGELYGGVLGLPIAFVTDRDGRIVSKHIGATKPEAFEREVQALLQTH
jgi:cytochrome c biogenesis protein CcmG, thiol:disulfide interchange protein DsbE